MNLDDIAAFEELDASQMITHIRRLPDQLLQAWEMGEKVSLPNFSDIDRILLCGVGSSAIAAEMVKHYLEPICLFPITVCQDCELPFWAKSKQTLILVSGFSGEEKELLAALSGGLEAGSQVVTISTGGSLITLTKAAGKPHLVFDFPGPSRAALGFEFVLPLAVLFRAGLINSPKAEIFSAAALMKEQQPSLDVNSPVVQNPAKRMAGQFFNRLVTIFASGNMHAVALRWKSQIHKNAKAWAQIETIAETRHSTAGGTLNPEAYLTQMMALFLHSPYDNPYDQAGLDAARRLFMVEGFNTDFYRADGKSLLENMWSTIQFGDFISYYLTMAYGMDPTPVPGVEEISLMLT